MRETSPIDLFRRCAVALAACVIVACSAPPVAPDGVRAPDEFPAAYYRQLESRGGKIWRVDPARSLVVIEVGRAGPLARLGHEHIVASRDLSGYVAPDEGRADLYVPLARLSVDDSNLRAEAGFDAVPPEAVAATRRNMLAKVLDVERFPFALIRVATDKGKPSTLQLALTIRGETRTFDVPAKIERSTDGAVFSGTLSFNQSDFGITPFSVLGGGLQVRDRLDLRFRIVARG